MPHQRSRSSFSIAQVLPVVGSVANDSPPPTIPGAASYIDDLRPVVSRRGSTAIALGSCLSCEESIPTPFDAKCDDTGAPVCSDVRAPSSCRNVRHAPVRFPYRFANLLHLPSRIMHPERCAPDGWMPPAHDTETDKLNEKGADDDKGRKDTAFRVGQPRSFRKTAANQIRLRDVLENRHLPPLTREEFTDYLAFESLSIENWYFYAWLEGYTHQYTAWVVSKQPTTQHPSSNTFPVTSDNYDRYIASHAKRSSAARINANDIGGSERRGSAPILRRDSISPADLPLHLSQSWSKALEAFFSPTSRFQLNLDADITVRISLDARHSPDPSVFRPAKEAVEDMLNASLHEYLQQRSGNAGKYRSIFAIFAGALFLLIGFALFAIALALRWPRAARIPSLPFLFLGPLTIVGGRYRTCLIMWLFGTCRQLRMCELVRPAPNSAVAHSSQDAHAFVPTTNSLRPPKLTVDGKQKKPRRPSRNSRQSTQSVQMVLTGGRRVSTVAELDERRLASTAVTPILLPAATLAATPADGADESAIATSAPSLIPITLPRQTYAPDMARGRSADSTKSKMSSFSNYTLQPVDTRIQSSFATYVLDAGHVNSNDDALLKPAYRGTLNRAWTADSHRDSENTLTVCDSRKDSEYSGGSSPPLTLAPWEEMEFNIGAGTSRDLDKLESAARPECGQYCGSAPVWAGLTAVLSPEIARRQLDIIITGSQYGLAVLIVVGAVVIGVPNPQQGA